MRKTNTHDDADDADNWGNVASIWQNTEEISVHTRKDDLRIVEVFVGEYRPQ